MIRILGFVLLVFALAAGFAWLADRPGDLVVTWQGMRHEVSLLAAAVALAVLIAAVMLDMVAYKEHFPLAHSHPAAFPRPQA